MQALSFAFTLNFFNETTTNEGYDVAIRYLQAFSLIFSCIKALYFIRCWDEYQQNVIIIYETLTATWVFFKLFFSFNILFVLLYINGFIDTPGGSDHSGEDDFVGFREKGMGYILRVFFFSSSNSIGDLSYPEAGYWASLQETHTIVSYLMLLYIWIIYYFAVYLMVLMLLNFLIAIMTGKYDEIKENAEFVRDQQIIEVMEEYLIHKQHLQTKDDNVGIVIIFGKKQENVDDEFKSLSVALKEFISDQHLETKNYMDKHHTETKSLIKTMEINHERLEQKMDMILKKLE